MWPGTGAPQLPQGWKSGACQRLAATRLFCLLRDLRRLGTAMVLEYVQGEKGDENSGSRDGLKPLPTCRCAP